MQQAPLSILILGGGAAGWLTAAILAAEHGRAQGGGCEITLVESPNVPTVGVGEGTWPSMRETLRRIGLPEKRLFTECDASFKQGSLFSCWHTADQESRYYHPFSLPHGYFECDLASSTSSLEYAYAVTPQAAICDASLAPKQLATPDYAGVLNYGYHFDAAKFGECLRDHSVSQLGVRHLRADVEQVEDGVDGHISALLTRDGQRLQADIFVDCSGSAGLIIGKHLGVSWVDQSHVLFNDRALAVQLPYETPDAPVASVTRSTARSSGWIWDIGLPTRRGMGYVYASDFIDDEAAEADFRHYLAEMEGVRNAQDLSIRQLRFVPGHRSVFWKGNCVAVGMAAGFIEPLEASALALIEQSAGLIRDLLPAGNQHMDLSAKRFNRQMLSHWENIVEFLKLHYVLSERNDSEYWLAHREAVSIPESLQENLLLWQHRSPARQDFPQAQPLFPPASYRYVLNGMGHPCDFVRAPRADRQSGRIRTLQMEVQQQLEKFRQGLPGNRQLIEQLIARGQSAGRVQ
ncbi:tryptophan halogenase family protein [Microbulbifer guangxiensis]|uniref:tryptophan halogenase family protein n=1 Tax=Microbulbifer guangxiensis TaxID=2904249 RepID=UPI001F1E27BA|nr:tryptophan halogenase family protein [Microbulbifer guangxiensis]